MRFRAAVPRTVIALLGAGVFTLGMAGPSEAVLTFQADTHVGGDVRTLFLDTPPYFTTTFTQLDVDTVQLEAQSHFGRQGPSNAEGSGLTTHLWFNLADQFHSTVTFQVLDPPGDPGELLACCDPILSADGVGPPNDPAGGAGAFDIEWRWNNSADDLFKEGEFFVVNISAPGLTEAAFDVGSANKPPQNDNGGHRLAVQFENDPTCVQNPDQPAGPGGGCERVVVADSGQPQPPTGVPEPSTLLLIGGGLALLSFLRRKSSGH
jgi:hypothetical protein